MPINATHRKRLARSLAAQTGMNYQQALDQVTAAADAGRLPRALDEAGMAAALRILTTPDTPAPQPGEALGLRPFEFRYVVYVSDEEVAWARDDKGGTVEEALARIVADVAGYCARLNPVVSAPERVALAGTDLVGYWETTSSPEDSPADECWRFTLAGTVRATFSDPAITGSNPNWEHSAQGVVDERSWDGAAHGWDWSFASFLDIAEPGALPAAHRPTPEAGGAGQEPDPPVVQVPMTAAPPATAPMFRMGGPYRALVYNTQGQRVAPACDVCGRHLAQGEPWWLVRQAGRSWASESGVCCAEHDPQALPPSPEDGAPVGMQTWDLVPNLLVQTLDNEVLKVSTVYPTRVTAQVVYPVPGRTTVREYTPEQVATWREPSRAMLGKYERAWGFRA